MTVILTYTVTLLSTRLNAQQASHVTVTPVTVAVTVASCQGHGLNFVVDSGVTLGFNLRFNLNLKLNWRQVAVTGLNRPAAASRWSGTAAAEPRTVTGYRSHGPAAVTYHIAAAASRIRRTQAAAEPERAHMSYTVAASLSDNLICHVTPPVAGPRRHAPGRHSRDCMPGLTIMPSFTI